MDSVRVGGIRVDNIDRAGLERSILLSARTAGPCVYAYVNVHAINLARRDERFREFINRAEVTYCDGEGVRLGARILGRRLPPRTVLTYWIWDLCRLMEENGLSVFLLGAKPEVVRNAAEKLRERYPRLKIAGSHHGYFAKEGPESDRIVDAVNRSGAHLLFVGFGMPLQEHWIQDHLTSLRIPIVIPSGSMIDYVAGVKRPTPPWMANHGLEWLYRLMREPRRLWRRYLLGNPRFLLSVIAQSLRGRSS